MSRETLVIGIGNLGTIAVDNIERLQDFHVLTGYSYDQYSKMVEAGHITGSVTNIRTNTNLSASDAAARLLNYLDADLLRVVIYQVVAEFESFFFDFLELLLRINTHALSKQRRISVQEVLDSPNLEQLVHSVIREELHQLQYENVQAWFEFLEKVIHLGVIEPASIVRIGELKATRDIFAHNGGVANEVYASKAGDLKRAEAGEELGLTRIYLYESADFLKGLVSEMTTAACSRLT